MRTLNHFFFLLLTVGCTETKSLSSSSYGCAPVDHAACDEVCKTDGMWYGHCTSWDGVDFQCKCFDYTPPLNSIICKDYKEYCNTFCMKKSRQTGYCYPAPDLRDSRGVPQCQCFKDIPQEFML
ncbi:hypothetical protein FO519_003121 [Halicephalobus sp. NKZ332]|nr:hypothetical protein FO519_003121 [Halicephalobus sp. NKZ332]